MIAIVLNGEPKTLPAEQTLTALCATLNLPDRGVAIAVNYELVARRQFDEIMLAENDVVEIVTATAGG